MELCISGNSADVGSVGQKCAELSGTDFAAFEPYTREPGLVDGLIGRCSFPTGPEPILGPGDAPEPAQAAPNSFEIRSGDLCNDGPVFLSSVAAPGDAGFQCVRQFKGADEVEVISIAFLESEEAVYEAIEEIEEYGRTMVVEVVFTGDPRSEMQQVEIVLDDNNDGVVTLELALHFHAPDQERGAEGWVRYRSRPFAVWAPYGLEALEVEQEVQP